MDSVARHIDCCFNLFDLAAIKKLYQARLDLWAIKYSKQSELVLTTFQSYYVQSEQSCVPVVHGSKLCQTCYIAMLGISNKRYKRWLNDWLASGKSLKRVVSNHSVAVRPAFMKAEIESYLVDLKNVTTCSCAWQNALRIMHIMMVFCVFDESAMSFLLCSCRESLPTHTF